MKNTKYPTIWSVNNFFGEHSSSLYLSLKRGGGPLVWLSPQLGGSCLASRTGVRPHFPIKSIREMAVADSHRGGVFSLPICKIIVNSHLFQSTTNLTFELSLSFWITSLKKNRGLIRRCLVYKNFTWVFSVSSLPLIDLLSKNKSFTAHLNNCFGQFHFKI